MATPDYLASLIGTESGGNWAAQNNVMGAGGMAGHFGRVQFGRARLQDAMNAGAIPFGTTPEQFMASPELQMAAEKWHFADLESQLAPYVGTVVNGKPLDMAALVAMGHLGGAGGAKKYVETGGAYNPSDAYGTSLSDYAATHGGGGGGMTASSKGGAPMGGLLEVPQQDPSGLVGLLTGQQKPWASKANDIGAMLLALSGSPAAQPIMAQLEKRKDRSAEAAKTNKTLEWLASQGRDDLVAAVQGGLSPSEAMGIALTPVEAPAPPKPIEVGGVLLDPETKEIIFDSRQPPAEDAPTTKQVKMPDGSDVMVQWNPETKVWDPAPIPSGGTTGTGGSNLTSANITDVNKTEMAYNSIVNGLDEYERIFAETGGQVIPGAKKDALLTARRGLQLQLKELFNLGVINGPDLEILDALLVDPTGLANNALDALGVASIEDRVTSNLGQVRTLLKQIIEAKTNAVSGAAPAATGGTAPAATSATGNTTSSGVTWSVAP